MCHLEAEPFDPSMIPAFFERYEFSEPEIELLWALLARAAIDYTLPLEKIATMTTVDPDERWCIEEAVNWVESDSEEPFSYLWVCDHLEICAARLRGGLQRLRAAGSRLYLPFTPYDRRV